MKAGPLGSSGVRSQSESQEALLPQSYALAPEESNSPTPSCDCLAHVYGNAADHPDRAPRYGSDMTDAEWQIVKASLPVPVWLEGRGGRPEGYCHRQILDAVRYMVDNGVKWRNLPADFPPYRRVHAFARRWSVTGLLGELHDRLRDRAREKEGRKIDPSAAIVAPGCSSAAHPRAASRFNRHRTPSTRADVVSHPKDTAICFARIPPGASGKART